MIKKYNTWAGLGVLDQMIVSAGNFATGVLLARYLGLEAFGQFTLIWMLVLFALSFNMAIITKPLLTLGSKNETTGYFNAVHTLQVLLALLGFGLTFLGAYIANSLAVFHFSNSMLFSLSFLVSAQLLYDFYRKYCFVRMQIHKAIVLDSIFYTCQLAGIIVLGWTDYASLPNVLFLLSACHLVILFAAIFFAPKLTFHIATLYQTAKTHLEFSGWLVLTAILQWTSGNYFIIAAGSILGVAAVGIIRIIQQLAGLCHILFLTMENLWPVQTAKKYSTDGIKGIVEFLKHQSLVWLLPLIVGMLGLILMGERLVKTLYNIELTEYYMLIPGFCLLYLFVFAGIPFRILFRTIETTKPIFLAYIFGAGFSLLSAGSLLKTFGLYGFIGGLCMVQLLTLTVYMQQYGQLINHKKKKVSCK